MRKEFMEPEVEVVEFEAQEEIAADSNNITSSGDGEWTEGWQ